MSLMHSELTDLLDYDPQTGVFVWKRRPSNSVAAGSRAGTPFKKGGVRIAVRGKHYLAHRLAWFYVRREWPEQIDHINGDRNDNRLANLRPASNGQNQANMRAKRNNSTGLRGIGFCRGRYVVQLQKGSIRVRRSFASLAEATAFAREKSIELHGDYSIHRRGAIAFVNPSYRTSAQ